MEKKRNSCGKLRNQSSGYDGKKAIQVMEEQIAESISRVIRYTGHLQVR